jgi:hypothetical protein
LATRGRAEESTEGFTEAVEEWSRSQIIIDANTKQDFVMQHLVQRRKGQLDPIGDAGNLSWSLCQSWWGYLSQDNRPEGFGVVQEVRRGVGPSSIIPPLAWSGHSPSRGHICGKVVEAARFGRKKRWHRDELDLRTDSQRLNDTEKSQLLVEIMLPDPFIAGLGPSCKSGGGGLCLEKGWNLVREWKSLALSSKF